MTGSRLTEELVANDIHLPWLVAAGGDDAPKGKGSEFVAKKAAAAKKAGKGAP